MPWQKALFILASFLVTVAFYPQLHDVAAMPKWVCIGIIIPLIVLRLEVRMTALHYAGLAIILYAALSLLWIEVIDDGLWEMWHLALLGAVFVIAAELPDIDWPLRAFVIGTGISSLIAIGQSLGWRGLPVMSTHIAAGFYLNQNFMAEACAVGLVVALSRRWWVLFALNVPAIVIVEARGALLGIAAGALVAAFAKSMRLGLTCIIAALLFIGAATILRPGDNIGSMNERLSIWADTWDGLNVMGHGFGSFFTEFPVKATRIPTGVNRAEYAHNEGLNLLFEMGIPGAILVSIFCGMLWARASKEQRMVFAAIGAMACFSFPLRLPSTAFVFALVAGSVCSHWHLHVRRQSNLGNNSGRRLQTSLNNYTEGASYRTRRGNISVQSFGASQSGTRSHKFYGDHQSHGCDSISRPDFEGRSALA